MTNQIRFASIPKCASRTLKEVGLLGESPEGPFHSNIKAYPEWESFTWYRITRPRDEWYAAWWGECKATVEHLMKVLGRSREAICPAGMQFIDMAADLALLADPTILTTLPGRLLVNAWLPQNCVEEYAAYLNQGKDFYQYCVDTITQGVPCVELPIGCLDGFLIAQGLPPVHKNEENYHAYG